MKRLLIVIVALTVAGCAGTLDKVNEVYTDVTGPTTIYQVKNTYAAADTLVINYRKYCWSKPYSEILADPIAKPVCQSRRSVVLTAQDARRKASSAIATAEKFIANNPTLSPSTVINVAWSAVTAYQSAVPVVK